jgi:hypothetical protein
MDTGHNVAATEFVLEDSHDKSAKEYVGLLEVHGSAILISNFQLFLFFFLPPSQSSRIYIRTLLGILHLSLLSTLIYLPLPP